MYIQVYIYIFMLLCVGESKAPPHTISQQDKRVLYQLPMTVISETGLNRFLGQ